MQIHGNLKLIEFFLVVMVKSGCGRSGHGTLELTVTHE